MKETEAKPALRISHIVHGRQSVGNRVSYLIDPQGRGTARAVPESVVLRRWRQHQFPGHRISGERLSSTRVARDGTRPARSGRDALAVCVPQRLQAIDLFALWLAQRVIEAAGLASGVAAREAPLCSLTRGYAPSVVGL